SSHLDGHRTMVNSVIRFKLGYAFHQYVKLTRRVLIERDHITDFKPHQFLQRDFALPEIHIDVHHGLEQLAADDGCPHFLICLIGSIVEYGITRVIVPFAFSNSTSNVEAITMSVGGTIPTNCGLISVRTKLASIFSTEAHALSKSSMAKSTTLRTMESSIGVK